MNADALPKEREIPRGLEIVIVTRVREIVDNFKVRRALPAAKRRMIGPFMAVTISSRANSCAQQRDEPTNKFEEE